MDPDESNANAGIKSLITQVDDAIAAGELDPDLRILLGKLGERRYYPPYRKRLHDRHINKACPFGLGLFYALLGQFRFMHDPRAMFDIQKELFRGCAKLDISKSLVSRHVSALERSLSVNLLNRSGPAGCERMSRVSALRLCFVWPGPRGR